MSNTTFDITIVTLRQWTGMIEVEIINFVQSNVISYQQLKNFWYYANRLPDKEECEKIYKKIPLNLPLPTMIL